MLPAVRHRAWHLRGGFAGLVCTSLLAVLAPSLALATFPGRDGLIAFAQGNLVPGGGAWVPGGGASAHSQIYTIDVRRSGDAAHARGLRPGGRVA